jgi:peptide/nickel transport system substrate-binding protein
MARSRKPRGLFGFAAAAAAIALLAAACSSSSGPGSSPAVKQGGILRIGTTEGIDSLNPFVGFNQDAYSTWFYIYPSLVQYDLRTFRFIPNFAKTWQTSPDGLRWTFHLAPNARWSDGKPLTAADVAWTVNTIVKFQNGPTGAWAGSVAHLVGVKATSPTTIVATYRQPVANVLSNLGLIPILPEHVWARYATGNGNALKSYPNTPGGQPLVGGGPFILVKYVQHQVAVFKRNPSFYGPRPHLDGFGLQFFESPDAMVTALKSGQLDAIEHLPPTAVATVKSAGFHVRVGPSFEFRDFIFNSNPKKPQHRELLNPKVRMAFEYAIDRQEIVRTAWLGYATPGSTIVGPAQITSGIHWHDSAIKPLPFDIAKANQLLNQAGYKMGPNGVRIADGHPMSYQVIFPHAETGPGNRAFQIIQTNFKQIGVQLTQKPMDDTAAFSAITAPNNKYLNFDLAMWDWVPNPDPDFILSILGCDQYGSWSDTGYCNHAYDKLYQEQGVTLNPQKRLRLVDTMQQMIYNARPYIVLTYDDEIDAWSTHFTGIVESPQSLFNSLSLQSLDSVHQT